MTDEEAVDLGVRKVGLNELFASADIIHTLASLTEYNRGRIGAEQLGRIRNGAVLINAGRAALIQQEALLAELNKERFSDILDVHYMEPLPADSPFRQMSNVILTPHNAGFGSTDLYVECVLDEFDRFFRSKPLQHEVTLERAKLMTDETLTGF